MSFVALSLRSFRLCASVSLWLLGFCLHPRRKQILRRQGQRLGEECLACGRWVGFQLGAERRYHLSALTDGPGRIERHAYRDAERRIVQRASFNDDAQPLPVPADSFPAARPSRRTM